MLRHRYRSDRDRHRGSSRRDGDDDFHKELRRAKDRVRDERKSDRHRSRSRYELRCPLCLMHVH